MLRRRQWTVAGLAATALMLAAPAGAMADRLCVGATSAGNCDAAYAGTPAGLQSALDAAELNNEGDLLFIGPGTFVAPTAAGFNYDDPESIQIFGSGQGSTVLRAAAVNPSVALDVSASGSSSSAVVEMTVYDAGLSGSRGLRLENAGSVAVDVRDDSTATGGIGVELEDGGVFTEGSIVLTGGFFGLDSIGDGAVRGATIKAKNGARTTGGVTPSIEVERCTITAVGRGVSVGGGGVTGSVEDSVIRTTGSVFSPALDAFTGGAMTARNNTLLGAESNVGVSVLQLSPGIASLTLDSSTVSGFINELYASESGGGNSVLNVSYSNYDDVGSGGGFVNEGAGNVNLAPAFVNPAGSSPDLHLLHSSPLVDIGNPAAPAAGSFDRDLRNREVDGDGSGGARRDIGAYEYQRLPPFAAISGPSTGKPGQSLGFSATGSSDPDPGDALTYSWAFGDSSSAAGPMVSHAFGAPGSFPITLTATDPTGLTDTAGKQVAVAAPPSGGGGAGGGAGGGGGSGTQAADLAAPVISRLSMQNRRFRVTGRRTPLSARRRVKRGSAFRFRLSETAGVRIGIERPLRGERVRGRCRRPRGFVPRRRRCLRWKKVGSTLARKDLAAGRQRVRFTGRFGRRKLSPGLYRAVLRAVDAAGNRSKLVRVGFRVVK